MAAYGAAVSLLTNLSKLHSDPNCPVSQIEELFEGVDSLKRFLVENREVKCEFETQIREAIYEAQDIIDSYTWSTHFLSPSEAEISSKTFCDDLERMKKEIALIAEMTTEEFNHLTLDRTISATVWRNSEEIKCPKKYRLIGRDKDVDELKDRLINGSDGLEVVPIVGIAGIGKTALARSLLQDPLINNHFDVRGRVKVLIKYTKHDILLDILASMRMFSIGLFSLEINDELLEHQYNWSDEIRQKTDADLTKYLHNLLKDNRYIILLDDIRDVAAWDDLKELFPNNYNGSRILLTTRYVDVAPARPHVLENISDEATLTLLKEIVFDGESCPAHLVSMAKDIASSCRGFPHAVVIVGRLLLYANPFEEYWEMVFSSIAACENCADLIEALVSLTYNHLPQLLKVYFLYTAIFPYNYNCPQQKLTVQWVVEGFVEVVRGSSTVAKSFNELFIRGFFVLCLKDGDYRNISMRIADEVFHGFLVRKAQEEKFFFVINRDTSCSFMQGGNTYNQQRRLCIQQNIHHFIKALSACNLNSSTRSLIYAGPDPQYRLRAWLENFKLLEVLDALKIGFYTFPPEIPKLVQLKYLAFSYNGQIPATFCNLRNLQVLIISDHLKLKCYGVPSYLPVEIWKLRDLMHLQVVGCDLPEPPPESNLKKLRLLINVSARSCTRIIFERIKKLQILEVWIESSSEDEAFSFFSYLNLLDDLWEFRCFVTYPDIGSRALHSSILAFPSTLEHLILSGCGFPWEYMTSVATLPKLNSLKLQTYAFQGSKWEVKANEFPKLQSLSLEDMGFENWTFASNAFGSIFPSLGALIIRHCYKLQYIPSVFADGPAFQMLEVVDCSTSAMNSALEIKDEILKRGSNSIYFDIFSSQDV